MDIEQMDLNSLRDILYQREREDALFRKRYKELLNKNNMVLYSGSAISGGRKRMGMGILDDDYDDSDDDFSYYDGGYGTKAGAAKGLATRRAKYNLKEIAKKAAATRKKNRETLAGLTKAEISELMKAKKAAKKSKQTKAHRQAIAAKSPWIEFVKKYAQDNGLTYMQALKEAGGKHGPYALLKSQKIHKLGAGRLRRKIR